MRDNIILNEDTDDDVYEDYDNDVNDDDDDDDDRGACWRRGTTVNQFYVFYSIHENCYYNEFRLNKTYYTVI